MPSPMAALATYKDPHYHSQGEQRGCVYSTNRLRLLRTLVGSNTSSVRVLEIGCGVGSFSHAAVEASWDVKAIEPGARFEQAHSLLGDRVRKTTWEEFLPSRSHCYDAIVAWEVIEHLVDPRGFLQVAVSATRPGGVVVLSTPNATAWSIRVLGEADPMLCPDEHLRLFSARGLSALVLSAVTRPVAIRGFGFLFAGEVRSGLHRATGHTVPRPIATLGSALTRTVRSPLLSLGLEAVVRA
jgi:SAM-dependent methyltransferase